MIPLRDSEAISRLAPISLILILVNVAVFVTELRMGATAGAELAFYAMIPAHIARASSVVSEIRALATLVSSQFMHASIAHLAGNMLYLFIFGPAIEYRMGRLRFLGFYLIAGIVAGLATVAMGPASEVAVIGASGAIAGVLGAYFVMFPGGRITTFALIRFIDIPAIFYLLIWFALQLYAGIASDAAGPLVGGVAWWAHVGGFLFGVATAPLFARRQVKARRKK